MRLNKQLLGLSGAIFLGIIVNLTIIFYWLFHCSTANTLIEQFFYCDAKKGPSLVIYLLFALSSIILAFPALITFVSSFLIRERIRSWIKNTILVVSVIVFILPFLNLMWISKSASLTLSEYRSEREAGRIYAEQVKDEWLDSEEYKKLQEEAIQKGCDDTREILKNWKEGELLPLLPEDCN